MITASRSAKLHRRPKRSLGFRSFRMSTKIILVALIAGVITPVAATSVAVATLLFARLPGNLPEKKPSLVSLPSYVSDSAGHPIGVFREFDLTIPVKPADIPQVLKDAVVAAEDRRFWQHKGVDAWGLARAAWTNYSQGETVQGGSTITQQYVKNAYLTGERTLSRKLREAILATQLERRMSKEEILFDYLNTIYFGSGAYGVGAAAVSYFGKPVSQLNLSEAAMLAGLIPAPTDWSPRVDSRAAEGRRQLVLKEMLDQRLISNDDYEHAKALGLWLVIDGPPPAPATLVQPQPTKGGSEYPHFVDWVEQVLVAKYGPEKVYRGGLNVQTTLDPHLQDLAQQAVNNGLQGTSAPVDMALVAVEPATGLVKAMVGGRDYNSSQVNLATGGTLGFQPGSSFKPFTLAAAFEQGIGPETVYNAPTSLKIPNCDGTDCYIHNVEGEGGGRMTVRNATTHSVNTVFAQLVMDAGVQKTAEMANRLGVTSIKPGNDYGVSLTLGAYEVSPLEMANGYATFANQGVREDATPILKVFDRDGHLLEDNSKRPGTRAISANVANNVTDLLTGVVKSGTGTAARLDRPTAGKTGTAEEFKAAWFVGYTPQLATAVWMGMSDGQRPLVGIAGVGQVYGGTIPARTWANFMQPAMNGLPVMQFPPPQKLQAEPSPQLKPGTGVNNSQHPTTTAPPDTSVKAADQQPATETPNDCGGPCQLYGGSLNLPLQIGPGAAAAPSGSSAPPSGGSASSSGTSPPR